MGVLYTEACPMYPFPSEKVCENRLSESDRYRFTRSRHRHPLSGGIEKEAYAARGQVLGRPEARPILA